MKHAMSTVALIAFAAIPLLGADVNPQDGSRRIVEDNFRALECSWTNSTKALECARILIDSIVEFDKAGKLDKADKMEDLTKFVEIVTSQKSEEIRCKFFMKWYDLVEAAAYSAGKSLEPTDVLLKWKFRLGRYAVMKADSDKFRKTSDPFKDGTFDRFIVELDKKWGRKARKCVEYYGAYDDIYRRCAEVRSKRRRGEALKYDLAEEENFYYDKYKCFLYRDYKKLPREQGKALVKDAEAVLGRPPKWYPPIDELDEDGLVARMERDAKDDYRGHMLEFQAIVDRVCAVADEGKRTALLPRIAKSLFDAPSDNWLEGSWSVPDQKMKIVEKIAESLAGSRRDFLKWSFRIGLLDTMKKELRHYADAWHPELPTNGISAVEVKMSGQWLRDVFKTSVDDRRDGKESGNKTRWRYGQRMRLVIDEYELEHFDDEGGGLEEDLARMTPSDKEETMKEVEAVLGRPPKWVSAEKRESK